jgi:dolichyl-phosphate beta-glucosyltransferase
MVVLSVVVPAYNEERRLGPSLKAICRYLGEDDQPWELIIVNDGSTDRSHEVMVAAAAVEPRIRVIESATNRGKGHAVRLGVLASLGQQVLICDADLATPIEEVEPLRKALSEGNLVAIGSRAGPTSKIEVSQGRLRETMGRFGNRLIRVIAVPEIADTQCGFKLFDGESARAAFAHARLNGWGFDFEILHLCGRFGWPIVEIPVRWAHQPGSKVRPLDYLRVFKELLYVRLIHRRTRLLFAVAADRAPSGDHAQA